MLILKGISILISPNRVHKTRGINIKVLRCLFLYDTFLSRTIGQVQISFELIDFHSKCPNTFV